MKKFIAFTLLLLITFFAFAEKRYYSYVEDIYCSYFELTPTAYEKLMSKKHDSVTESLTDIRNMDIKEKRGSTIISEYELAQFIGTFSGPEGIDVALTYLKEKRCYFYFTENESNHIGIWYFYK